MYAVDAPFAKVAPTKRLKMRELGALRKEQGHQRVLGGVAAQDAHEGDELVPPAFAGEVRVLHWGEHTIGQALAIARYLTRRLGLDQGRDCENLVLLESVTSAAYLDLTCIVRDLLRPRVMRLAAAIGVYRLPSDSAGWRPIGCALPRTG